VSFSAPSYAQTADSQSAAADTGGLDEIVVTAQKREQNLRNVPIAISAIGAEKLTCPLLVGPKSMLFWTRKEKTNAMQETQAGGDYRQAA
jgi:hypothetical protein